MPRGAGYSRGCQDELVRRKQETTNFETKVSLTPVYNGRVVMSYFRKTLDSLRPYEPGEQPAAAESIIKLNTNENPYPASPRAMALLHTIDEERLRRYPTPYADEFRAAAAEILGVGQDWILVGNGSDDILTMLIRAVSDTTRPVAYPTPTYALYRTLAQMQNAPIVEVRFDETYTLPVDALAEAGAALTLVASPNSPSGNRMPNDAISTLADRLTGLLVVDEAYVDFATDNALDLTRRHDNVIVLRTLSKGYSLAGLRLGFAVGPPDLLAELGKVKDSYNVDAVSAQVGAAAYRDVGYCQQNVERVCRSRQYLTTELTRVGFYVWPREANFVLGRPSNGRARELYEALKTQGILVRYFDTPELKDTLRITVGTDAENEKLVAVLTQLVR